MENLFKYLSKPLTSDDVDVWFRINNIIIEKLELYSDFFHSLNNIISETYLGFTVESNETKITLNDEDNDKHFNWCWNKVLSNFDKENIKFKYNGEHLDYFKSFYIENFYSQKEKDSRHMINVYLIELFDVKKPFTKSDLDMLSTVYKILDNNLKKTK